MTELNEVLVGQLVVKQLRRMKRGEALAVKAILKQVGVLEDQGATQDASELGYGWRRVATGRRRWALYRWLNRSECVEVGLEGHNAVLVALLG